MSDPKTKPDNPQAFPRTHSHGPSADGMTLRDWFAGQALAGVLQLPGTFAVRVTQPEVAACCYEMADAMLAERARK
jgi:hypothetical protein